MTELFSGRCWSKNPQHGKKSTGNWEQWYPSSDLSHVANAQHKRKDRVHHFFIPLNCSSLALKHPVLNPQTHWATFVAYLEGPWATETQIQVPSIVIQKLPFCHLCLSWMNPCSMSGMKMLTMRTRDIECWVLRCLQLYSTSGRGSWWSQVFSILFSALGVERAWWCKIWKSFVGISNRKSLLKGVTPQREDGEVL